MSTQQSPERRLMRWKTLRGLASTILFLLVAVLVEYLIILYAVELGLKDYSVLQWSFVLPSGSSPITVVLSPMLHLVPICIIAVLSLSWAYLTKQVASRRQEIRRGKVEISKRTPEKKEVLAKAGRAVRSFLRRIRTKLSKLGVTSYLSRKMGAGRFTLKSAFIVFSVFAVFTLLISLFAYPQLIYRSIAAFYRANPGMVNFVASVNSWANGVVQALGPIGWIAASINNGLLAAAPSIGNFGSGLGDLVRPLASLDDAGKFLFFQNAAAWTSVLVIILYGERSSKTYRYKK